MRILHITTYLGICAAMIQCNEAEFGGKGVKPGSHQDGGNGTATSGDNPFGGNPDGFGTSAGIDAGATIAGANGQDNSLDGSGGANSGGSGDDEFGGEVSLDHCADPSKLKTIPLNVVFTGTINQDCQMRGGSGGNDRFKAATRQVVDVPLPGNKLLCSINLSGSNSSFKYDDVLILGIQNIFIATSHPTAGDLASWGMPAAGSGYRIHMPGFWGKLKYGSGGRYCVPGATCTIPASQTNGYFNIGFPVAAARILPKAELAKQNLQFALIIGGNGERGDRNFDCSHNGITLSGSATYISN